MLSEVIMQEKIPDKTPRERFSRNNCPPIRIYPGKSSGETVVRLLPADHRKLVKSERHPV